MSENSYYKPRTSRLWQFFKQVSPGLAKCCLCRKVLSFKSSITNLKRHLDIKHAGEYEDMMESRTNVRKDKETSRLLLTTLVQMHPCLWDTRCEAYGNVQLQTMAWNTIATRMCPKSNRSKAATTLSKEFNDLRNDFLSNPDCSNYGQLLSFMRPLLNDKNSSHDEGTEADVKQEPSESRDIVGLEQQPLANGSSSLNRSISHSEECLTNEDRNDSLIQNKESDTSLQQEGEKPPTEQIKCSLQLNHVDDSTLFLLSLVDDMKTVPKEHQISFKTDLMVAFSKLVNKYENLK